MTEYVLHNTRFEKEDAIIKSFVTMLSEVMNAYNLFSFRKNYRVCFDYNKMAKDPGAVDSDIYIVVQLMIGDVPVYEEKKEFNWKELKRKHNIEDSGIFRPNLTQLIDEEIRNLIFIIIGRAFAKDALTEYQDIVKRIEGAELELLKKGNIKDNRVTS